MKTPPNSSALGFKKIAILGLGLMGTSLSLALRKVLKDVEIKGYDRSQKNLAAAKRKKACHTFDTSPEKAVEGADLVVLAIPVDCIESLALSIRDRLKPGCIVTDIGSTKKEIVRSLQNFFSKKVEFLGGHPIAGTEKNGAAAAQMDLFQGKLWILTPTRFNKKNSILNLKRLLQKIQVRVEVLSPQLHDKIFASVSHFPHLIAFLMMDLISDQQRGAYLRFSGTGFKDSTRIAASSPEIWTPIFLSNGAEILPLIQRFQTKLAQFAALIRTQKALKLNKKLKKISDQRKKI